MVSYDIDLIRAEFPSVSAPGAPVYLDNPGGTQVPQQVVDAMVDCLINCNANLGGPFATSVRAGEIFDDAHAAMADFVNANDPGELIFGHNMTTLTLHISRSIARTLKPGDEIILTTMDHDANVAPWLLLAEDLGLTVHFLPFERESFMFDPAELEKLLSPKTRLVALNHASNMTGTINDVAAMTALAKQAGALVFVDSVQFAPHAPIDVQAIGCDFLACSPYKFFGPHMGVLWGKRDILMGLEPYKVRAAGAELPDRFETGTLNHEGMAGTTAAVNYIASVGAGTIGQDGVDLSNRRAHIVEGFDQLFAYEKILTEQLIDGLQKMPGVTVQGITSANAMHKRVPTISFTVDGVAPKVVSTALADKDIQVWDGHNYALEPINRLGLMDRGGVVRVGIAHYNTAAEIDACLAAIADAI